MSIHTTGLEGAGLIEPDRRSDDRGFFARFFCKKEFAAAGLETDYVQINNSYSRKAGTLRGLHYQLPPSAEVKLVRCIHGSLWDCIVDLRPDSETFGKWFGATLSAQNRLIMYVPKGFAHGFISLSEGTEVFYLVSAFYAPSHERGFRWDDPRFDIKWPREPSEVSEKDRAWRAFEENYHGIELFHGISAKPR